MDRDMAPHRFEMARSRSGRQTLTVITTTKPFALPSPPIQTKLGRSIQAI